MVGLSCFCFGLVEAGTKCIKLRLGFGLKMGKMVMGELNVDVVWMSRTMETYVGNVFFKMGRVMPYLLLLLLLRKADHV